MREEVVDNKDFHDSRVARWWRQNISHPPGCSLVAPKDPTPPGLLAGGAKRSHTPRVARWWRQKISHPQIPQRKLLRIATIVHRSHDLFKLESCKFKLAFCLPTESCNKTSKFAKVVFLESFPLYARYPSLIPRPSSPPVLGSRIRRGILYM